MEMKKGTLKRVNDKWCVTYVGPGRVKTTLEVDVVITIDYTFMENKEVIFEIKDNKATILTIG